MARMSSTGTMPHEDGKTPFDIISTYQHLLRTDPELTMPVAAIESLVLLLAHSHASTISETLDLLATSTAHLKRSVANPISLSAGTDLFQRYLITTLQRPTAITAAAQSQSQSQTGSTTTGPASGDFKAIRQHLLSNGRLFVQRAKESRRTIARFGRRFIRDGSTVLTNGGSRVVGAVLQAAAEAREEGSVRFKVIYVQSPPPPPPPSPSSSSTSSPTEGAGIVSSLRRLGVPVATISESAVAYSMGRVTVVLVGAEGVVENGGIISRMGTYQMGILAKSADKPFYVVAESHKFVRLYPLGQYDLPIEQKVLDFTTVVEEEEGVEGGSCTGNDDDDDGDDDGKASVEVEWAEKTPFVSSRDEYFGTVHSPKVQVLAGSERKAGGAVLHDAVDYTPPDLITALITESGVHTPSAVSEELIKIWY